jgi:hypothetical protein
LCKIFCLFSAHFSIPCEITLVPNENQRSVFMSISFCISHPSWQLIKFFLSHISNANITPRVSRI